MTYTADATELAIKNEQKRLEQESKAHQHRCYGVLVDWGCKKRNEPEQEVGLKSPCTAQIRSGDALESNPSIPHITLTEQEYSDVCDLVASLGHIYSTALKKKFVSEDSTYFDSKVNRINLGQAITKFSQNYQLGS